MIRFFCALALCGLSSLAHALDSEDQHWYANELTCWGKKYVIRNFCQNEPGRSVNRACEEEELTLEVDGVKKVISLHQHQPYKDDFFWLGSVRCGELNNEKYFYLSFDNGGNCTECEVSATLRDDGVWAHFGDRWFVKRAMKKKIQRAQAKWFQLPANFMKNKTLDKQQ